MRAFDVPMDIEDIPIVLEKYPNVELITVVHNRNISNEEFLSLNNYPQLQRIIILTRTHELVPFSTKFQVEKANVKMLT